MLIRSDLLKNNNFAQKDLFSYTISIIKLSNNQLFFLSKIHSSKQVDLFLSLLILFLKFSKPISQVLGPIIMANRKPVKNARRIQLYYNIFHLTINIFLFYRACLTGWLTFDSNQQSFRCSPVNFSMEGKPLQVSSINFNEERHFSKARYQIFR